jgi:hypothetical protein
MRFIWLLALLVGCVPQQEAKLEVALGVSAEQRVAWGLKPIVTGFVPDRGEGGQYKLRERVFFSFSLKQAGYVTLVTMDADGTTVVLERNVPLKAGKHAFPLATDRSAQGQATYLVVPPLGASRFRLLFTDIAIKAPELFKEKLTNDLFDQQTQAYLGKAAVRDAAETTLEAVKP